MLYEKTRRKKKCGGSKHKSGEHGEGKLNEPTRNRENPKKKKII